MNHLLASSARALELLARNRNGMSIDALAKGLALPHSSCARLVSDLVALGWAERGGPRQRVHMGPRAESLARAHPYRPALLRAAEGPMARLSAAHHLDAVLAVMRDGRSLMLIQHQQVSPEVEARFRELESPYYGAAAHVLVAQLDWRGRRRIWKLHGPPWSELWPGVTTWTGLNTACAVIRQRGHEINRPPRSEFAGLAVPIPDGEGGWAALGLRCPAKAWDEAYHVRLLHRLARAIRRRLGATDVPASG